MEQTGVKTYSILIVYQRPMYRAEGGIRNSNGVKLNKDVGE